jgi:hypothetical protein
MGETGDASRTKYVYPSAMDWSVPDNLTPIVNCCTQRWPADMITLLSEIEDASRPFSDAEAYNYNCAFVAAIEEQAITCVLM